MKFAQNSPAKSVALQTSFDDAHVYPFIKEEVPITRTTKIISTDFTGSLHEYVVDAGYWDGIRILMPDWHGGNPRHSIFVLDGVQYDAYDVDWYDTFLNWQTDGDRFFWYPAWLRAVPVNTELDEYEASKIYDTFHGLTTPDVTQAPSAVVSDTFTGASAHNQGHIFFSAKFDTINNAVILVDKLRIQGVDTTIPQEENAKADVWYPIAPL